MSDNSSTSEEEVSASSSKFNPIKALYSAKTKIPAKNAPMYDTVVQYEASLKEQTAILPVGSHEIVRKQKEEKEKEKLAEARELEEKNRRRFEQYGGLVPSKPLPSRKTQNVLTRMEKVEGPLAILRECVDQRLRVKVVTRNARGVRGALHANLVAFDKQWNMALTDVLEVWTRKAAKKRKIPPAMGTPVPKGTAATISPVPLVRETPLGKGVWECSRFLAQLMVRGEHVVLVNIER